MERYKSIGFIGEGSFGRVYKGENIDTKEIVALKFIPKRNKVDREVKILKGECDIQQGLFHPNIVRMIDCFETEREVVAVSEYVPVQLFSKLKDNGKIPEFEVRQIACNLVSAIYYLHSLRILHRDIKPQNILLTSDGVAKLCDFGFSRKMGFDTYVLTSIKGTPLYMAPEVIKGRPYDQKVDLWSLGCILFELLTGKPPFNTTSIADLVHMIQTKNVKWPDDMGSDCSSFLKGLLQKDPNQRLGWPTIIEHVWIKDRVILLTISLDNPLTSPLSSFQQKVKEDQKLKLMYKAVQSKSKNGSMFKPNSTLNEHLSRNEKLNIFNVDLDTCNATAGYHDHESKVRMPSACGANNETAGIKYKSEYENYNVNHKMTKSQIECKYDFQNSKESMMNEDLNICGNRGQTEDSVFGVGSYLKNSPDNLMNSGDTIYNLQQTDFASFFVSDEKLIERDEWARFLDKALVEILEQNFSVFFESSELSLFLSPLQCKSCPIVVTEKVISLLRMPFVLLDNTDEDLKAITNVYYDCKVLPNLVYTYADLHGENLCEENCDIITKIMALLCYLCHSDRLFVYQLCDIICILSVHKKIGALLESSIGIDAKVKIIAILTQVLRTTSEKSSIVREIVGNCGNIYHLLATFMSSENSYNKTCLCNFVAYGIGYSCLEEPFPSSFFHDIANMKTDTNISVRNSVIFAIKSIEMFTNVFEEVCFV